jgi:hypothetical protein
MIVEDVFVTIKTNSKFNIEINNEISTRFILAISIPWH